MKLAIILKGFSILNNTVYSEYSGSEINYKNTIMNTIDNLRKFSSFAIDLFFHTYNYNNNIDDLLKTLKPTDFVCTSIEQIKKMDEYINAHMFSLLSSINVCLKYMTMRNKTYDIVLIFGFDYIFNKKSLQFGLLQNDELIIGNRFESIIEKTKFDMSFHKLINHKDNLFKQGFIFGMHNDYLTKLKTLTNVYIDGHVNKNLYTIFELFMPNSKILLQPVNINGSFHLLNVKSNRYITIPDPSPKNINGVKIGIKPSVLHIYNKKNKCHIRYDPIVKNQNGSDGWHLYTIPNDDTIFGAGNDGDWAVFIIENKGDYYVIKSIHGNDRYLYVDANSNLKSDGNVDMEECLWNFVATKNSVQNTHIDKFLKLYN